MTGSLGLDLSGEDGGGSGGAGGLAGELRPLVEEAEGVLDLLLGDQDALDPVGRSRSAARPANGAFRPSAIERGVDRRRPAGGERLVQGGAQLGLDRDDAHARRRSRP